MRLTIEKVLILKSVSIFADTPEEALVPVAEILEEIEVAEDEVIFKKGEIGTSMYIIADGKVKVHDGEQIIVEMKERDMFGDLALLDPEPRSASVTALQDTSLLRLEQDAFYELTSEHIEVTRGVIHSLCRRLRAQKK